MYKLISILLISISFLFVSCGDDDKDNIYSEYDGIYEITEGEVSFHDEKYFKLKSSDLYTSNGKIDFLGFTSCSSSSESSCDDGIYSNYSISGDHPGYRQIQSSGVDCLINTTYGDIEKDGEDGSVILTYTHKKGRFQATKCDFDTMDENMDKLTTESIDVIKARLVD